MTRRGSWALGAAVLFGLMMGLGFFTFGYARGASYLTNDPAVCANCHIMNEHYSAWLQSSHRAVAGCNDCHTPHNVIGKYASKAVNGFWHSFYFTTGNYPDPLRITPRNSRQTERSCRGCHADIVAAMDHEPRRGGRRPVLPPMPAAQAEGATRLQPAADARATQPAEGAQRGEPADAAVSCVRCHTYVGHWVR